VVCATDANHLRALLRASVDHPGAMYLRLGRGRDPQVYAQIPEIRFGKAICLREGRDAAIIATGSQVRAALDAAMALEHEGISVRVADMFDVGAIDRDEVAAAAETGAILTVEEHNLTGGLGSAVADALVAMPREAARVALRKHGVPDRFVEIGPPAALYAHYRLDAAGICSEVRALLEHKGAEP